MVSVEPHLGLSDPAAPPGVGPAGDAPAGEEDAYFSELLGYSLDRLSKEPELLRADQERLRRQIQDTAVAHYRGFVDAARCLDSLRAQVAAAGGHLDALARDLPELQATANEFRRNAAAVDARRAANRQLLSSHGALVELLEAPQLMETCIRNGSYDEALDLRAFISKLAVVHGDLPAVRSLVAEAEAACGSMLASLLGRLEGPVQLPECLRIIGYLRRLAAFSEPELRRAFLSRRDAWVAGLLRDVDAEVGDGGASGTTSSTSGAGGYEYLKRLTDVYRLHLFDVVMQYRAVFADEPAAPSGSTPGGTPRAGAAAGAPAGSAGDGGGILAEWAARRVAAYLAEAARQLPRVPDGASLASVLDHAMYAGLSLGRVGLDFRPALAPLFERRALQLFAQAVATSTDSLAGLLDGHRWVALPAMARPQPGADAAADAGEAGSAAGGGGPPASLVEHVPLAVYTNGLLSALNELRHCAPLLLREPVARLLSDSLARAAELLAAHGATRTLGDAERGVYDSACRAFASTLCPYVASCMDRIYSGSSSLVDVRRAAARALGAQGDAGEAAAPPPPPAAAAAPAARP